MIVLGLPLAVIDQTRVHEGWVVTAAIFFAGGPLIVLAYLRACSLVLERPVTRTAAVVALAVYVPFPLLNGLLVLPGVAWFALAGLAVPACLAESLSVRPALRRGLQLGRADFVHAFGSFAALVIVVGIAEITLSALLHTQSNTGARAALFVADLILTPLLYLGGPMLYLDQVARVRSRRPDGRSGDADLHSPLTLDPAGRPDPQGES